MECALILTMMLSGFSGAGTATFDDLSLGADSYWNGSDESGGFTSGGIFFNNNYNSTYGSWDGWSYSNKTDMTTAGYGNQYSAITGGGQGGSSNYGVSFVSSWAATLPRALPESGGSGQLITGGWFTNTTYAYLSMRDGDSIAKKFGGTTGNDPDWFLLTLYGLNSDLERTGNQVDFYLADYRFEDNSQDYIVNNWRWVDLNSLGNVCGLEFSLSSSDMGQYGMNTPAYFAMDGLVVVPEPCGMMMLVVGGFALLRRNRQEG